MFDDKLLKDLPQDWAEAGVIICDIFFKEHQRFQNKGTEYDNFDLYVQALAFANVAEEVYGIKLHDRNLSYHDGASIGNLNTVVTHFKELQNKVKTELTRREMLERFEEAKTHYASIVGKVVSYEFSDSDFKRVQALISELRDVIAESEDFEEDHKARLLKRLEKLQAELHKKMSNLDMLWGLIGDAGVAMGKFGENAKPFVDRIGEILQITSRTQAMAESMQKTLPLRLLTEGDDQLEEEKS